MTIRVSDVVKGKPVAEVHYQFVTGRSYTRQDVFKIVGIADPGGGAWYTGYTSHRGTWFIFCGIDTPGRTGHDYHNHFVGADLVWFGKTKTTIHQPAIRAIADRTSCVYVFYRNDNRAPFTFAGSAKAKTVKDTTPVEILWSFERPPITVLFPEEICDADVFFEGAKKTVTVNVYERDVDARAACLHRWGLQCTVCSFDFKIRYGELGEGFIHVHHLLPLSEIGTTYKLDPIRDLRPVCPNCHSMLHRRTPVLDIEALQQILRQEKLRAERLVKQSAQGAI